jgi:hypothetical protein
MEQGFVGQAVLVLEGFAWLNQVYRFEVGAIEFEALNPSWREFTLEDEDGDDLTQKPARLTNLPA